MLNTLSLRNLRSLLPSSIVRASGGNMIPTSAVAQSPVSEFFEAPQQAGPTAEANVQITSEPDSPDVTRTGPLDHLRSPVPDATQQPRLTVEASVQTTNEPNSSGGPLGHLQDIVPAAAQQPSFTVEASVQTINEPDSSGTSLKAAPAEGPSIAAKAGDGNGNRTIVRLGSTAVVEGMLMLKDVATPSSGRMGTLASQTPSSSDAADEIMANAPAASNTIPTAPSSPTAATNVFPQPQRLSLAFRSLPTDCTHAAMRPLRRTSTQPALGDSGEKVDIQGTAMGSRKRALPLMKGNSDPRAVRARPSSPTKQI